VVDRHRGGRGVDVPARLKHWLAHPLTRDLRPDEAASTARQFAEGGRLTSANGALRDRATFEREFPEWRIDAVDLSVGAPFRYLLSGGVSLIGLTPASSFGAWRLLERALAPVMSRWAMFAMIRLPRVHP